MYKCAAVDTSGITNLFPITAIIFVKSGQYDIRLNEGCLVQRLTCFSNDKVPSRLPCDSKPCCLTCQHRRPL